MKTGFFYYPTRILAILSVLAVCSPARTEVHRYAVLIGNNRGLPDETVLLYAERDVSRIRDILAQIGNFPAQNLVLVTGQDARTVKKTLKDIADQIGARLSTGQDRALLFVYYSGHADVNDLHLNHTRLSIQEIRDWMKNSCANLSIFILDACRSGSLTKLKGFKESQPFPIRITEDHSAEGSVYISSTAVNEDAQESDTLQGSFFTHHFASALLGAADDNSDGRISLWEAYRYTYTQTISSSSRTLSGIQHPTYRYDLKGRQELVLTDLATGSDQRAHLRLPGSCSALLIRDKEGGELAAEVNAQTPRQVTLPPGRYFVRLRMSDHLREGTVTLESGKEFQLNPARLERVPYARLVRKGIGVRHLAHGPVALFALRPGILDGFGWHALGGVGYPLHLPWFSVTPRLLFGGSSASNEYLDSQQLELAAEVSVTRSLDLNWLTLAAGINLGGAYLRESFNDDSQTPARNTGAFIAGLQGELIGHLGSDIHLRLEVAGVVYVFKSGRDVDSASWVTPFVPRFGIGIGYSF